MKEKLKKLLLSSSKESRNLGREIYETIDAPTEAVTELYRTSLSYESKGIMQRIEEANIHVYDPYRVSSTEFLKVLENIC